MATIEIGDWLLSDERLGKLSQRLGDRARAVGLVILAWLAKPKGSGPASWSIILGVSEEEVRALRECGFLDEGWQVVDERPFRRRRRQAESQRRRREAEPEELPWGADELNF